ncbi:MAG TPA: hypothetical protein VGE98_11210, partial [Thermoanaerobaculia bacterium]
QPPTRAVPAVPPPAAASPSRNATRGEVQTTPASESRKRVRPQPEPRQEADEPQSSPPPAARKAEAPAPAPMPAVIPSSLPMEELRPLAGGMVKEAGALRGIYDKFLDQKKDSGAELSEDDDALRAELKVFEDAADAFNQPFRTGLLAGVKKRVQHLNEPEQIVRRARLLMDSAGRVEALLPRVKPTALQQAWRELRHERQRIATLCQL